MQRGQCFRAGWVMRPWAVFRSFAKCVPWVAGLSSLLVLVGATGRAREAAPALILESKFELFVSDGVESAAFYDVLGFAIVHQKAYGYTTLRSGSTVIALSPLPSWLPIHWFGSQKA